MFWVVPIDAKTVDAVWTQWEQLKKAEKQGTEHERSSVLDGIPRHLPALHYAEKLVKKARKHGLINEASNPGSARDSAQSIGAALFDLTQQAQAQGQSAEALLREEIKKREATWRSKEEASAEGSH